MASAMATMELVSSFYHHHHFHHICYQKHIRMLFLFHSAALTEQATQNSKWESLNEIANPQCGKGLLRDFNSIDYASLLEGCTSISALKQFHAHLLINGLGQNIFFGTKLVNMYGNFRNLVDARFVFDNMRKRNVFSWNGMIAGYAKDGNSEEALRVYHQMQQSGVKPDKFTFPFVLKACAGRLALQEGKMIHKQILRSGCDSDVFVGAALVNMYAKCGVLEDARQVFDKMSRRDVVSWNAMVAGYAQNGRANEALALFNQMQLTDVKPNSVTVGSVLPACAQLGALQQGKWIHDCIIQGGLKSDIFVDNSLIDMYSKCGNTQIARRLFDKMSRRDVVSWNAMIAGYAQNGHAHEVLTLFHEMELAGLTPDPVTIVSILTACAYLGALEQGKQIHNYVYRNGFEADIFVGNSLIDMYAKCGRLRDACILFLKMPRRSVISWNAIIAGYAQNGYANEALTLFRQMQLADVTPDSATMVSVLSACANLGALQQGRWIHDYIIESGFECDAFVGTALIDMYAKCGSIESALHSFVKVSERNVASWNAIIAGYGMHGHGEHALALFCQMLQTGTNPDHITFTCVLSACSHAGLVDEGLKCFDCMSRDYCITPRVKHYACMVDLLGRAGHLDEAYDFIKKMPLEPDASVWGALLGACRIHCNIDLGECAAKQIFNLEPENAGYYVLLSNMYATAGRWDDVAKLRSMMKDRGLRKTPGWSLIEVNNEVHEFLVGNN
eukprot:Gb_27454 [translate_table: standard]